MEKRLAERERGKTKRAKIKKIKKKKKAAEEDEKPELPPPLIGPSEVTTNMFGEIKKYEDVWQSLDEAHNFSQKHDVQLAKKEIRVDVEKELRDTVDTMLQQNLLKIKAQLEAKKGGKKGKK